MFILSHLYLLYVSIKPSLSYLCVYLAIFNHVSSMYLNISILVHDIIYIIIKILHWVFLHFLLQYVLPLCALCCLFVHTVLNVKKQIPWTINRTSSLYLHLCINVGFEELYVSLCILNNVSYVSLSIYCETNSAT